MERALVTGGGGFIGDHLVRHLKGLGYWVRAADQKLPEYGDTAADEFEILDLRRWDDCLCAPTRGVDHVYALAADMGGMGFISANHATIMRNNVLISTHTIEAARVNGASRLLYASSACVYPEYRQLETDVKPLREEDAYPAAPQDAYGWEKLSSELMCAYYAGEFGLDTRVVRFHNVYGPRGAYDGGREKAPAALCRKIALAPDGGAIELWGDGAQTRSFCYVDDCVDGILRLMQSDYAQPLNLGSDRLVTIDELANMICDIAGKRVDIVHVDGPQGVRGRNSDNTRLREVLAWEPQTTLEDGLTDTYRWIEKQLAARVTVDDALLRVDVLGVTVCAIDMHVAVERIGRWIETREQHYVCVTSVHGVMEAQRDAELLRIHNASGLTTPDGVPLVWAGRFAGASAMQRVCGAELLPAVCAPAARQGWKFYFYGGNEGVPERLAGRLSEQFPGLKVAGTYSPPFRALTPEEDDDVVERINAVDPDIVWVGLSTPKQERWMAAHVGRLHAPVLVGVGAAFDLHAGLQRRAPVWMQRAGLEWLYRLAVEPRRLSARYLRHNPRFVVQIVRRRPRLVRPHEPA